MDVMRRIYLGFLFVLFVGSGCDSASERAVNDLRGEWRIAHSERMTIFEDGTTDVFEDQTDAGTLTIFEGGNTGLFTDFVLTYTNFQNTRVVIEGTVMVDESTKRVLLAPFACDGSIFNCTLVMNVVKDDDKRQVWDYFYTEIAGGGQGLYDPTIRDKHFRWRLTLRK